jgi:hypothetical protein
MIHLAILTAIRDHLLATVPAWSAVTLVIDRQGEAMSEVEKQLAEGTGIYALLYFVEHRNENIDIAPPRGTAKFLLEIYSRADLAPDTTPADTLAEAAATALHHADLQLAPPWRTKRRMRYIRMATLPDPAFLRLAIELETTTDLPISH